MGEMVLLEGGGGELGAWTEGKREFFVVQPPTPKATLRDTDIAKKDREPAKVKAELFSADTNRCTGSNKLFWNGRSPTHERGSTGRKFVFLR